MQASTPDKSGSFVSSSSVDEQAGPGVAFKRLAARYLHPFNLDSSLAKLNIERIRAKARGLSADGVAASGYRQVTDCLRSTQHCFHEECHNEVLKHPEPARWLAPTAVVGQT